jgi:hypothetical protein
MLLDRQTLGQPAEFIDRADAGVAAISADREWHQARFAEMAGDERREAFEIVP